MKHRNLTRRIRKLDKRKKLTMKADFVFEFEVVFHSEPDLAVVIRDRLKAIFPEIKSITLNRLGILD